MENREREASKEQVCSLDTRNILLVLLFGFVVLFLWICLFVLFVFCLVCLVGCGVCLFVLFLSFVCFPALTVMKVSHFC